MVLHAKETFFVGNRKVTKGQLVNPKDPIVKGREALFEDTEKVAVPAIPEQASRNPGQRRAVAMPKAEPKTPAQESGDPGAAPKAEPKTEGQKAAEGMKTSDLPKAPSKPKAAPKVKKGK